MTEKEEREKLKQYRIMRYFIDATIDIIKEDGISGVTIRKVANYAGYTSATLYNYFDNLTHLIFLANMCHLEEYNHSLPKCMENCTNPVELYMSIGKCYTEHAYSKPEIFELLFFSQNNEKFEEYTNQYYELYPKREKEIKSKLLNKLFHVNDLHNRSLNLLKPCVEQGMMEEQMAIDYTDICLRFNKTILEDVKDEILNKEDAIALTLKYYTQLLGFYLKPEFKHLIDDYKKKN